MKLPKLVEVFPKTQKEKGSRFTSRIQKEVYGAFTRGGAKEKEAGFTICSDLQEKKGITPSEMFST